MARGTSLQLQNHLLKSLSEADLGLIQPHLTHVELAKDQVLVEPAREIEDCWFIESGVISVIAGSHADRQCEVGIVGRGGMVDIATAHFHTRSSLLSIVQAPGTAYRIRASYLQRAFRERFSLHSAALKYALRFFDQVAATTLANASSTIEQRLVRWLLLYSECIDDKVVRITHAQLAFMLNVRRSGVTEIINALKRAGAIKTGRGLITIADQRYLRTVAGDTDIIARSSPSVARRA